MMGDKKALQAGTSHYLGQNFSKAFNVKFQDIDNKEKYVYATSWGVSTRLIGALIMVHGDDKGLRLPPKIAPIQIVIVPIYKSQDDLNKINIYIQSILDYMKENNITCYFDTRDKLSPGFKFNEWEMKGVPLRIEVGMRDVNSEILTVARRDNNTKETVDVKDANPFLVKTLDTIQSSLYNEALAFKKQNTFQANDYEEFKKIIAKGGFVECGWDGTENTESKIKKDTNATIRCIPFEQKNNLNCIYTQKPAKYSVIFAKAY
tara:strand:- start:551 stop:1336 length:786 start_codon:yes stop_codon:yes gene_type:complete